MFPKIHPANTLCLFSHIKALRILFASFKSHYVPKVKHRLRLLSAYQLMAPWLS